MATVTGSQFHMATHDPVTGGSGPTAGSLSLSSLSSTVAGGGSSSGFDTVNSPGSSTGGSGGSPTSDVVATQSQDGGNVVVHLSDGSSITVVGTNHIDATFSH